MKPHRLARRTVLTLLMTSAIGMANAQADGYPYKPVRIITPAPAGNGPDVIGRIVADRLSQRWGQQVTLVNRPGAGGLLAAEAAVAAEPDGYTLYLANTSSLLVLPVTQVLSFDLRRDLVPIGLIGEGPFLVTVSPSLGVSSLQDFIALAKKRPGELLYAAAGRGSLPHLASVFFCAQAGIDLTYVPYPTTPQSINDIMGGRLSAAFEGLPPLKGAIAAGAVKPLAVTSAHRLPDFPQLPTVAEIMPGFGATGWTALMAPARTPDTIVQKVSQDLRLVLAEAELRQKLEQLGAYVRPMSPAELANFIETERGV